MLHIGRICAGLNFADATLYIAVVSILATFDIRKPLDDKGNEVEPSPIFTTGLILYAAMSIPFLLLLALTMAAALKRSQGLQVYNRTSL